MNLSIRWKVTLATVAAVILGLTVAGWLTIRSVEESELIRVSEMLDTRGNLIAHSLRSLFDHSGTTVPRHVLQATALELSRASRIRVTVVQTDGAVLADSSVASAELAQLDNHATRPEIAQALVSRRGTDIRASRTTGERTY